MTGRFDDQLLAGPVDVRRGSPTFARHVAVELDEADGRMLWVPPGFAHGFCVLSDRAAFMYKCTDFYAPEHERSIVWNDPDLNINWGVTDPLVSNKDQQHSRLASISPQFLPQYRTP